MATAKNVYPAKHVEYRGEMHDRQHGFGHLPGSFIYKGRRNGRTILLFAGEVLRVSGSTAIVRTAGNKRYSKVRVPAPGWVRAGFVVTLGPVREDNFDDGHVAECVWPAEMREEEVKRVRGYIAHVECSEWGKVVDEAGRDVFIHVDELRGGARLKKHARVTFRLQDTVKGFRAADVRPDDDCNPNGHSVRW